MELYMKRRDFIRLAAAAAATWPSAIFAQRSSAIRRIGILGGAESGKSLIDCFIAGLNDLGWIDGTNFSFDIRWAEGIAERYSKFATELVSMNLDLIVVSSTPGTQAVQLATKQLPIVFIGVSDPVKSGIV